MTASNLPDNIKKLMRVRSAEKYLKRFLSMAPISVAVWRSVEAKYLATVDLKKPVLDVGCGFGEFARGFFDGKVDVGIDIAQKDLNAAKKSTKYKKLVLGDARSMPFNNNYFTSAFSISTLEHIQNSGKVLSEVYRVLKPNGIFVATIETDLVDKKAMYSWFPKKIGLKQLSKFLTKQYNKLFSRQTLVSKNIWEKKFSRTGFKIEHSEMIISPIIVRLYDIFVFTAWPSQILKPILGRRVVYRPDFITSLLAKIFIKYVDQETKEGTNLFIVAKKPK